jgi:hypothetical protein
VHRKHLAAAEWILVQQFNTLLIAARGHTVDAAGQTSHLLEEHR